jgi:predicted nucleotidyltransferase
MNRNQALAVIQRHRAELKELGVVSLSLFGSTARNEADANSDVDVAVRLEDIPSGFATLARLDRVRERLSELLGVRVDVVPEPEEPGRLKAAIDRDRCLAF